MAEGTVTDRYWTIKKTRAYTGLSESSIRTYIKFGILPAIHDGCYWLPREAVEEYMRTRRGRLGRPRKTTAPVDDGAQRTLEEAV
jgi:hypothetical protein